MHSFIQQICIEDVICAHSCLCWWTKYNSYFNEGKVNIKGNVL